MRRRIPSVWGVFAFVIALVIGSTGLAAHGEDASTAMQIIERDARAGLILEADALLYKLSLAFDLDPIPAKYSSAPRGEIRCATQLLHEARGMIDRLPKSTQRAIETLLARPTQTTTYIDTEHFRIHYNDTIANPPNPNMIAGWDEGSTSYLDAIADAAEASWRQYHIDENWQIPPGDGTAGGGLDRIDCYVYDLGSGFYGFTQGEDNPVDGWDNNRTAYFVIDNDYSGFAYTDPRLPMRVTVAHEYHHVVQMGYTIDNGWWMENLSTFMEDEVYDEIDDNQSFLTGFTNFPYQRLDLANAWHEYGAFVWPTYIKERWAHDVVRQIEECSGTTNIFTCFETVFGGLGSSLSEAFEEFAVWNFYTVARADGTHFVEANDYRNLARDGYVSSYPRFDQHPSSLRRPQRLGISVVELQPSALSTDNILTITYDGPACTGSVLVFQKLLASPGFIEHVMLLNASGFGELDVSEWDETEFAEMYIVMPYSCGGDGSFDYRYDVQTTERLTGIGDHPPLYSRRIQLDQNAPNPFGPVTKIHYEINESGLVGLEIFDAGGRKVRSLVQAVQPAGRHSVTWDSYDDMGHRVNPGVYFYRLNLGDESDTRKMILVSE